MFNALKICKTWGPANIFRNQTFKICVVLCSHLIVCICSFKNCHVRWVLGICKIWTNMLKKKTFKSWDVVVFVDLLYEEKICDKSVFLSFNTWTNILKIQQNVRCVLFIFPYLFNFLIKDMYLFVWNVVLKLLLWKPGNPEENHISVLNNQKAFIISYRVYMGSDESWGNLYLSTQASLVSPMSMSPSLSLNQGGLCFLLVNSPLSTSQPRKTSASPISMPPSLPPSPDTPLLLPCKFHPLPPSLLISSLYLTTQVDLWFPRVKNLPLCLSTQEPLCFTPCLCPPLYLSTQVDLCFLQVSVTPI